MKKYFKFLLPIGALALTTAIVTPIVVSCSSNSSTISSSNDTTFYNYEEAMNYVATQTNNWLKQQKEQTYTHEGKEYKINLSEGFVCDFYASYSNAQPANLLGTEYQPELVDGGKVFKGVFNAISVYVNISGDKLIAVPQGNFQQDAIHITFPMKEFSIKIALSAFPQQPPIR